MPALASSDRPPSWWLKLTKAQRTAIVARLRKLRKTDATVPDPAAWQK